MHRIYYIIIGLFLLNTSVCIANTKAIDSIGVENNNGKKLILHRVEPKETYYAIAKRYNVSYKDLMEYNDSKALQIGIILKVPTHIPFDGVAIKNNAISTSVISYTVKAKDNLNMLAEKFGTSVDEIKKLNNLASINLQIGQTLQIPTKTGIEQPITAKPEIVETPKNTITTQSSIPNTHTVKAKENLNLLAKIYGTTVEEIKKLNGLSSINLQIGQVLQIPIAGASQNNSVSENPAPSPIQSIATSTKTNPNTAQQTAEPSFEHVVIAGETIYSIAKKYNLTTYQLKSFNNLTVNELTLGQKLIIKGEASLAANTNTADDDDDDTEPTASTTSIKDPKLKYAASRYGLTQFEEKGAAVWIADPDLEATKMLVLHRTAPIGTIIKITNPMTNRSTFAKVVGKFTENETTKDVIIVMTKAVADAVGALDKRFFCNINYGAQENEQP